MTELFTGSLITARKRSAIWGWSLFGPRPGVLTSVQFSLRLTEGSVLAARVLGMKLEPVS